MRDIAKRIDQLLLGQRTTHPVGKLARFVDLAPQDSLDQIVVGDRVAIAERHRSHLRVEDRAGGMADQPVEDLDVLTGSMKDFHAIVGSDQVQERADIEVFGQRVDQAFDSGRRRLHKAEFRPISRFPMKLGIDADKIAFGQFPAEIFKGRLLSNGSQGVVSHRGLAYRIARTIARG